ncbi:ABC transporter substrate-binding protein [Paenibacillus glycanilyticus]|uniref:ABC transporter substrate-binding protein n=1 Tax=Paenibacillus glycanilyticus TaxID=126569 RepID=A0ABQ6GA32_9BACL|nr:ABC transporter substrate-binding protein [Paenibacillus glycanilyticus]GLX67799.1 ABC transporter substrate-binding protein [Paenibacillus glycanilyticus]
MNIKKNRLIAKLLTVTCVFVILAACSSNNGNNGNNTSPSPSADPTTAASESPAESTEPALDPVKLTFLYPVAADPGPDQKLVNDEINKYLQEKINATVELKPLTFDEYEPKLNAMLAANENFDIAWSSKGWLGNYQPYIDRGAYLEITDDMLAKYAPEARANIPDKFWPDMFAADGKVYGFPIYQVAAKQKSLIIQKRFIDKYNLDVSTIHSYADIEPFLQTLKENEPDVVPLGLAQNSRGMYVDNAVAGTDGSPVYYKKDDPAYTLWTYLQSANDRLPYYQKLHDWYEKGYINQDAPVLQNINDLKAKGNVAVSIEFTSKPGGEIGEKAINGGNDVVYVPISDSYFTGIASAMHVINKNSKNPERALMLINLLNTDKYLYNLICNGIEGKHYEKVDDTTIKPIEGSGYAPNGDWVFGNQFNAYLKPGMAADTWQKTIELNDNAVVLASSGFGVNEENIKAENANINAVKNEYETALETGAVDPNKVLPEYVAKLKASGQEKVDAEVQKQWDAFLAQKGLK